MEERYNAYELEQMIKSKKNPKLKLQWEVKN